MLFRSIKQKVSERLLQCVALNNLLSRSSKPVADFSNLLSKAYVTVAYLLIDDPAKFNNFVVNVSKQNLKEKFGVNGAIHVMKQCIKLTDELNAKSAIDELVE